MPDRGGRIRDLITDVGQLVFYGPPGTGKTYTAQQFARWWLHEVSDDPVQEQLETVTFHPSFSYEDFIEGLTAQETDDGGVAYEIEEGVFKRIAERAREAYQENPDDPAPFVLIIDEINRGNLAQIFGETITALEADKRLEADNEVRISLAHSRKSFTVPPNFYVIGTMNTADRSIALVDAALRRRFRFIGFPPNYEALSQAHDFESLDEVEQVAEESGATYRRLLALSILAVRHLNTRILDAPDLGKGKQIGHSFLWGVESSSDLCTVWQFEILPLLEEYYFGQFEGIRNELFQGTGEGLFDYDYEQIREISPARLAAELAPLVGVDSSTVPDSGWTDTGEEQSGRSLSIHAAIEQGLVEAGDVLLFNERRIPEVADREYNAEDPYWQCEVTGDLGQADNVRWLGGDEGLYSLSGLARRILNELGDDDLAVNDPIHWCVPEHGNEELRKLVTSAE